MTARVFLLPDLGEGLTEAEIIAWHVTVGEHVSVDQVVCEVETAKASVEVPCPYAGEVVELHGAVGDVVDVGKPLISIAAAVVAAAGGGAGGAGSSDNRPQGLKAAPEEPADRARLDAAARNGAKIGSGGSAGSGSGSGSGNVLVGYGTAESGGVRRRRVVSGFGGHGGSPRVHGAPVAGSGDGGAVSNGAAGSSDAEGNGSAGAGAASSGATSGAEGHGSAHGTGAAGSGSMGSGAARDGSADSAAARHVSADSAAARNGSAGSAAARNGSAGGGSASSPSAAKAVPALSGAAVQERSGAAPRIAVVSPLVRRLAKEGGLDLASVQGTGPEGLIMRRDVEAALAAPAAAPASLALSSSAGIAELERVPLRGLRKTVAEKLSRSRREIPDATTWVDVDATGLMELRAALNRDASARKISLLAVLARICVAGLARYPELNATVDVEQQEIVRYADVNLGFAAQTDRGLVVPVVHGAHRMSTEELAAEFERLTAAARAGSLPLSDLTGSTFTLNNYGVYGVDGSTPILNHPEAAMLGVGRIVKKPWVVADELAIRQVTQLSFTFDHRVCDGGVAGGFLRYVADLVEEPARLLRSL
ncbi:dihydrolipoamide acetyltransferase family protein [Catenulispora acidiphila]|uniref:dihydrolipoamide acetyltransferase family protein n=1 Tax=Catenulispora acidiphila TaxID=304895 RepID=UPI001181240B|nr:dihydrolipoamide acetyltransferase family protein [Catenulispora acidiphila]